MLEKIAKQFVTLFVLLCTCGTSYGEIYKWVDENGKVHYTQTPPSKSAEKMDIEHDTEIDAGSYQNNQSPSSIESQRKYSDYLEQERLERKEKREQKKKEKEEARSKCNNVRAQLGDMEQGGILYYELDKDGERKFVSDDRVDARMKKLRNYLKKNCGGVKGGKY